MKGAVSMIRQAAFNDKGRMLKGGLHCHTTRSDGAVSPEETILLHEENGYDFLAITDHRIYNYKNFTPDSGVLIVPGMEMDNGESMPGSNGGLRFFHTLCIGPSREDGNGFFQDQRFEPADAPDQEAYQPCLDDIHRKNNLTIYCHPEWSCTPAWYFEKLRGNFAMEIWNTGCVMCNDMDKDAACWDELLGQGIRIYGVATDDGHAREEHCKGWVMVRAEKDLNAILSALEQGEFYSSCGPEIYDFYVENGKAVIDCSPVKTIRLHCDCHPTRLVRDESGKLTHAEIELNHWTGAYPYVRMSVIDGNGKYAWTNPIFL